MRPILEYGSSVWDPYYEGLIEDLEKVQKRAARFVTRKKVQVGKDQEKAQSEKDSHSKNQGGKKPN